MQVRWQKLFQRVGFWLAAEILLNLLGLDNLADYSEFIFDQDWELDQKNHRTVKISAFPPEFCIKINENCPIPGTIIKDFKLHKDSNCYRSNVLKNKCKKLKNPCIKVWYIPNS